MNLETMTMMGVMLTWEITAKEELRNIEGQLRIYRCEKGGLHEERPRADGQEGGDATPLIKHPVKSTRKRTSLDRHLL